MKVLVVFLLLLAITRAADAPISISTATRQAKTAAKQGDAKGAETWLLAANRAPLGTFDWHTESAQRLISLAYALPREGSMIAVPLLIASALQHLAAAETLVGDSRRKGIAKALAGHIHEFFRGDHAAALEHYRAAAQLNPGHPAAQHAANRLEQAGQQLRARGMQ